MGKRRARLAGVLVALAVVGGAYVATADPAAAGNAKMDGIIRKGAHGPFEGVNVFNETGEDQTVTKTATPGQIRSFYARFVNRSSFNSFAYVTGSLGTECFRVRYFDRTTNMDITPEVVSTLELVATSDFKSDILRIEVKAKACATPGEKHVVAVDVEPILLSGDFDRVRAKLKVV